MPRVFIAVLLATLGSCVLAPPLRILPGIVAGAYCASVHPQDMTPIDEPDDGGAIEGYTPHALATARLIGARGLLARINAAIAQNDPSLIALRLELNDALTILSDRELRIVRERCLNEDSSTLESLGNRLGISKERVRQIENRALEKLRRALEERYPVAALHASRWVRLGRRIGLGPALTTG